jgi:hypothetical protein
VFFQACMIRRAICDPEVLARLAVYNVPIVALFQRESQCCSTADMDSCPLPAQLCDFMGKFDPDPFYDIVSRCALLHTCGWLDGHLLPGEVVKCARAAVALVRRFTCLVPVALRLGHQTHGLDGILPTFGPVALPASARLHIDTGSLVMQPLDYLALVNRSAGEAGVIAGVSIAFTAPNENTLEGCTHLCESAL